MHAGRSNSSTEDDITVSISMQLKDCSVSQLV